MPRFTGTVGDDLGQRTPFDLAVTVRDRPTLLPQEFGNPDLDQTDALTAWIKALPRGTTVDWAGAAVRCDRTITLSGQRDLTMLGGTVYTDSQTGGLVGFQPIRTRSHWRMFFCEDIKFIEHTVRGAHSNPGTHESAGVTSLEAQHAFEMFSSKRISYDRCTVSHPYGDCFYIGKSGTATQWCEDITIDGGVFGLAGRQIFGVVAVRGLVLRNFRTLPSRRAVFDFEPHRADDGVDGVLIENILTDRVRLNALSATGIAPVNDVTIRGWRTVAESPPSEGGHLALKLYVAPDRVRSEGWVLEDMWAANAIGNGPPTGPSACWSLKRVDGVDIRRCYQRAQSGRNMCMVQTTTCTDVLVADDDLGNPDRNSSPGSVVIWRDVA